MWPYYMLSKRKLKKCLKIFSKKCRISKLLLIFRMFEPLYERFYDAKIDDLGIILIFQTTVIVVFGCTFSGPRIFNAIW